MSGDFSHFDETGNAHMVDVGDKAVTKREAVAEGRLLCAPETLALIVSGGVKKGDVFSVARLAGIMGAKQTSNLIPLCHPLTPLARVGRTVGGRRRLCRWHPCDLPDGRQNRGGNGSTDGCVGHGPDGLRHGQGGSERHGDRPGPVGEKIRWQIGDVFQSCSLTVSRLCLRADRDSWKAARIRSTVPP